MPRIAVWVFRAIVALTLFYFLQAFLQNWEAVSSWSPNSGDLMVVVAACLLQGMVLFLLAEIWHRLVSAVSGNMHSRHDTYGSYCLTQIGKYLPGNVFHLIGRHLVLTKKGVTQRNLVLSLAMEVTILVAGALIVSSLAGFAANAVGMRLHLGEFEFLPWLSYLAIAAFAGLTVGLLIALRMKILPTGFLTQGLYSLSIAMAFFASSGLLFWLLSQSVAPISPILALFAVPLAWVVGYVTPGAPGGLGVREASLLLLLTSVVAEADALIMIGLFRLIAICGDLLFYCVGRLKFRLMVEELIRPNS